MTTSRIKTTGIKATRDVNIDPNFSESIPPRQVSEHIGYIKTTWNLIVDLVFSILLRSLTREEFERLEGSIVEHGFDPDRPIIIWNGMIIDGHHRYAICKKHNLPYYVIEKEFTSRKEASAWIIENQADRRHSSKLECVYLFYEEYLATKKSVGAPLKSREMASDDDGTKSVPLHRTREKLAKKWKISPQAGVKWIKIGKAIDIIAMNDNKDAWDIVTLLSDASHEDILKLARLRPESQKRVIDSIVPGIDGDLARKILHDATHPKLSKHKSRESKKMKKDSVFPIFLDSGFPSMGGTVGYNGCLIAGKYKDVLPEKINPYFLSNDMETETHEWFGLDFPTKEFGMVFAELESMDMMIALYDVKQDKTRLIAFVKNDAEIPESIHPFIFEDDGYGLGHQFSSKKNVKEPEEMPEEGPVEDDEVDEDEEVDSAEDEPEEKPEPAPAAKPKPRKVIKIPEEMPDEDEEEEPDKDKPEEMLDEDEERRFAEEIEKEKNRTMKAKRKVPASFIRHWEKHSRKHPRKYDEKHTRGNAGHAR